MYSNSSVKTPSVPALSEDASGRLTELMDVRLQGALWFLRPLHFVLKCIERATDAATTFVQNVRVNHRRPHIGVAQELLDRAEVIAIL